MKKIFIILSGFLSIWIGQVRAQLDDTQAHHRYWYYKHRLQNDFMAKEQGNAQGTNIPASIRGEYGDAALKWGDATIDLGFWIGTLATEYRLLIDNGRTTEAGNTLIELREALLALNRLDVEGDYQFGATPALNGFMIRDDVPSNFLDPFMHPYLKGGTYGGTVNAYPCSSVRSGFTSSPQRAVGADQIIYIYVGLRLVKKFVPASATVGTATFAPYDNTVTSIAEEAEKISERIWTRLKTDDFLLRDPSDGSFIPNGDGGNVVAWAVPISIICDLISPSNAPHTHAAINPTSVTLWTGFGQTGGVWPAADAHMIAALGNMSNTFNPPFADAVAAGFGFEIMPLLRQALFGGSNLIDQSNYENLIGQAPCYGPYNWVDISPGYTIPGSAYPNFEWSSSHRWVHPERRHNVGDHNDFPGQYNGLDYMLLHNLFYLVMESYNAENLSNLTDANHTWPVGTVGTTSMPSGVNAYETLHVSALTVSPSTPTNVTYHAGYYLRITGVVNCSLRPTGTNAIFHAYVNPFTCGTDEDYHIMETDTSSQVHPIVQSAMSNNVVEDGNTISNGYAQAHDEYLAAEALSVAESDKLATITIAPNPTTGAFQISLFSLSGSFGLKEIAIYDLIGNKVWEANCQNQDVFSVDLSGKSKGFYLIKLQDKDGKVQTEKLILK